MAKAFICRDELLDLVVCLVSFLSSRVAGYFAIVIVDLAENDYQQCWSATLL